MATTLASNTTIQVRITIAAKLTTAVKRKAEGDIFKSAGAIVDEVILDEMEEVDAPCPTMPKPENLVRAANRLRQKKRPGDPTDLEFLLNDEHIPDDFLKGDIRVPGRRHLIFATTP